MKCLTKFLCIFLIVSVIFTLSPMSSRSESTANAKNQTLSFADLYMDLPMHYTLKNNYPEFSAQDYNLFESMFTDAGLTFSENGFKRSFFASTSKNFDLQQNVTKQSYSLYLKILSVLVIHRKEEDMDFGYGYYLSGIRCPNNERLFIIHYNDDFSLPIYGVLCSSSGEKIWQWNLSKEASRSLRPIDQTYEEIANSLVEKNLSTFVDPLRVLLSSWMWSGYLEKFDIPVMESVSVPWDSELIPKTRDNLLKQLTDNYIISNANYSWSEPDTEQLLKCLEAVYSERWSQKYMNLTFARSYTLSKPDDTSIFIPYISVKFKIDESSFGYGFSGLKDSGGSWSFWINDKFYFPDQKVILSKAMNSRLLNQEPNRDPFVQYLLMVGTFAFQQIDTAYFPTIILAYASSLYDVAQTQKINASPLSNSRFDEEDHSMFMPNCESLFRSVVESMDLLSADDPIKENDLASLAKVLASTGDLQNEPITSYHFDIMKSYKMYNRDTGEGYLVIPYLIASITFQNGEMRYFHEYAALQNAKKAWVVLDGSRLWKVAFSSGIVSDDAYFMSSTDELSKVYLAYQLHYSYFIRQQLSMSDLADFTTLFSIVSWKNFLHQMILPKDIPTKDLAYTPTLPNLGALSSYLADHFVLSPDSDFQMTEVDKKAIQDVFKSRLQDRDIVLDWSTFQIKFSTPFQIIGENGAIIHFFKEIRLDVRGSVSSASSQQSWIRDDQGMWVSFSPLRFFESTAGWKIQSISDFSGTRMSAYTTYIGFYARANWEKSVIPCPDLIPLLCSLDLRFNTRKYKN
jgi:hypothetical protein